MVGLRRHAPAAPNAKHFLRRGAAKLGRLGRDNRGTVVVIAGIVFPVVVGGMGLGVETGYWYYTQRKLQHAADVSVYAAAVRKSQQDSDGQVEKVALHVAEEAGFDKSAGVIEVNSPPKAPSAYAGQNDAIQVILSETRPRLFTSIFTGEPLTLTGRAVAEIEYGSSGCVLALSGTASAALKLSGSANITLEECDVAANSVADDSFNMQGSSKLSTGCVYTAGGASMNTGLTMSECEEVREYGPRALDPYADVAQPEEQGNCENRNFNPNQTYDLEPYQQGHPSGLPVYRFCGNVDFKGTVNFGPGLYIFSRPLGGGGNNNINVSASAGAVLTGTDVTFFFTDGVGLNFNGNATINLSARTEDPYAGILFFSDRNDVGVSHTVNGGAGGTLQGAVYFPSGDIKYAGGANVSGGCTQVIGNTVEFTGNAKVSSDCAGTGVRDMQFGQMIAIIE